MIIILSSYYPTYREFWNGQNPDIIGDSSNYYCDLFTAVCSLHLTNLNGEKKTTL